MRLQQMDRPLVAAGGNGADPLVIELRSVTKTYGSGRLSVTALDSVDLSVGRGEFVAVMGASGSGKSTLMNIIGCLDVPTRGLFHLDGVDVRTLDEEALSIVRNRKIGFVFQSFNLIPRTSALANVELPLAYSDSHGDVPRRQRLKRSQRRERAMAALRAVGLADRAGHGPSELSGGQIQRVAVARALVNNPAMILADEPTGNLDSTSTADVMELFARLNNEGRTIVLITHEDEVASWAKRVVLLRDGRIVSDEPQKGRS